MNRRELLAGAGALAAAGCDQQQAASANSESAPPAAPAGDVLAPFAPDRLMRDVEMYVGFGTHRSGSSGDLATSEWFARRWSELRYVVEQTEFPVPNSDTTLARLEAGGKFLDGFAQPPLAFTQPGGVTAPLVPWSEKSPSDVSSRIAVVHIPRPAGGLVPQAAYRDAYQRCERANALGVVAVLSSPSGEPCAINTPVEMVMQIPVLAVGEKNKAAIDAVIASKQPAKLSIEGPGGFRNAKNTIAKRGTAGPWVIISTPQSGWFTCGGERGPGIAMSLALSEWAAQKNLPVRFLFIATSGHEWTDFGAHLFHDAQAPDPKDTALWFHLGAGFGARAFSETAAGLQPLDSPNPTRTLMLTEDLAPLAQAAFAGQVTIEQPQMADARTALGEYRLVVEERYPSSAGFWGMNSHFHTPVDGAASTTGAIMAPIARAIAQVIEQRIAAI
jgi:hypothetical protein